MSRPESFSAPLRPLRLCVILCVLGVAACGKKGPPLPPLRPIPARIADLAATRREPFELHARGHRDFAQVLDARVLALRRLPVAHGTALHAHGLGELRLRHGGVAAR